MQRIARVSLIVACLSLILAVAASPSRGDVKLPAILSDGMVLQQKSDVRFWGEAETGETVSVAIGSTKKETQADKSGRWMVSIPAPPAGGPYEVVVAGKNTITLKDVLCGETWVCSGQSNMQWTVAKSIDAKKEIAAADYPNIRLITVPQTISQEPLADCKAEWKACSPTSIPNFSGVAYFFGRELHKKLGVPIGLIHSSWGGTQCEAWTSREALASDDDFKPILDRAAKFNPRQKNQGSVLYNGMIRPIEKYTIQGAIWYQGEGNVSRAEQYHKLFPTMIADWRERWGLGDFPFLFVQIAPYQYDKRGGDAGSAELREAQRLTLEASPNTGMAVTTDVGNVKDIHPKNKQEVGRRLALWALAKTYGDDKLVYSGPLYKSMKVEGNKIRLQFDHVADGLKSRDGKPLSDFQIAGADEKFVPAEATIDGSTIVVSSKQVASPAAVRFGWTDVAEPNLVNSADLPASTFRTDAFQLQSAGKR